MNAINNPAYTVSYGAIGATTSSGSLALFFIEATGVLTNGFVYNTDSTIWLNLDPVLTPQTVWTLLY